MDWESDTASWIPAEITVNIVAEIGDEIIWDTYSYILEENYLKPDTGT